MSFMEHLTDDQIVLFGCTLALLFCLAIVAVTPSIRERVARMVKSEPKTSLRFLDRNKRVASH